MIIMKFGGTSVGGADEIRKVSKLVHEKKNQHPVVVVSAVSGITDMLLKCAEDAAKGIIDGCVIREKHNKIISDLGLRTDLVKELHTEMQETLALINESQYCSKKQQDKVASYGERISARIVAAYISKEHCAARAFDAYDIGFVTDDNHADAEILPETYANIKKQLDYKSKIPVITGFIAKTKGNRVSTLGRGGSDYTAAIIGAAHKATEIQVWTDVSGIMSADPRVIPKAMTIDKMSFAEASELAYFGAKVLHPKTILPAVKNNIPVKVLNTNDPNHPGTTILHKRDNIIPGRVRAVTSKKGLKVITITSTRMLDSSGFMKKLFDVFARNNITIDMIATSEVSVSATVNGVVNARIIADELKDCATVNIENDKAIVCVVGEGLNNSVGLAGKVFSCVGQSGVNIEMISQGASEINVSFVVDQAQADIAVKGLHKEFMGV